MSKTRSHHVTSNQEGKIGTDTNYYIVIASECSERSNLKTMEERNSFVYMMTNKVNTVIYTGVTSDLKKRVYEHKEKVVEGFTKKYNVNRLVYYEIFDDIEEAIEWEKKIKAGSRTI